MIKRRLFMLVASLMLATGIGFAASSRPASAAAQPGVGCSIYSAYCWYRWQVCGPWYYNHYIGLVCDLCGCVY